MSDTSSKYELINTFTNYPSQMEVDQPFRIQACETNCASEISSNRIPTQTSRQPCTAAYLSSRRPTSLIQLDNQQPSCPRKIFTCLRSSVSIKPPTGCERSMPMPQYNMSSSKYLFQYFSLDTLASLTRSLSLLGYSVYNLDCIMEVDEPLFFVFFQWSLCPTPKPRPGTLPLLHHSWHWWSTLS